MLLQAVDGFGVWIPLQVGESQFVTLDSARNAAEFVRPDDGEVCLHFEMAHQASQHPSKDKGMCSTQLPLAALDGRKVRAPWRLSPFGALCLVHSDCANVLRRQLFVFAPCVVRL